MSVAEKPDVRLATVQARCVRLPAKAADAASIWPVIETHALSRGENDLLIEVKAAAVNPSDVKAATGLMPYAVFPRTPGRDYAGVVIDGPTGWIGREVFGSSGDLGIRRDGTHATHLVVEAEAVVEKPKGISWEETAGIGVQFVTLEFYRGQHTYVGIDTLGLSSVATGAVLQELGPGFASGHLKPFPIKASAIYPLEQAKAAFVAVAGLSRDRVILRP